jgi:hypothetical protein
MQSSLMMHATLAIAAMYWAACFESLDPLIRREGYRQQGAAMEEIRMQLSLYNKGQYFSEEIIAGVTSLANAEVSHLNAASFNELPMRKHAHIS